MAGLKWRVLINTLTRSTWILVGTILGGLYALFLLGMALTALIALGGEALETVVVASVLLGSLLLVGWWLVPLVSSKADSTLDPSRLALFPLSTTGLVAGQVAGAVVGLPGVLTVIALLGWLFSWRGSTVALIAAIPCAIIGALLAFVGSRCVTALGANFAKGRRTNEIISMVVLVLVVLLGPLISLFATGLGQVWQLLPTWAGVLAWTPLGAIWAVPGDVASGYWLAAPARGRYVCGSAPRPRRRRRRSRPGDVPPAGGRRSVRPVPGEPMGCGGRTVSHVLAQGPALLGVAAHDPRDRGGLLVHRG